MTRFISVGCQSACTVLPEGFTYTEDGGFTDILPAHPQFQYIKKLKELGLSHGCDANNNFCDGADLTYGQIAKLAVLGRQWRDNDVIGGTPRPLVCQNSDTLGDYHCTAHFADIDSTNLFFPYIQRAYRLLGARAVPPGCAPTQESTPRPRFCEGTKVQRGWFAVYLVSLIMGAQDPTQWPNGGNLTAVKSPNSP
ncbi:MAG: hypothetical protein JNL98_37975, partial [Bryobacterales bacterium]|nr:hypothetical protein [Bryobacterales bacterium]